MHNLKLFHRLFPTYVIFNYFLDLAEALKGYLQVLFDLLFAFTFFEVEKVLT